MVTLPRFSVDSCHRSSGVDASYAKWDVVSRLTVWHRRADRGEQAAMHMSAIAKHPDLKGRSRTRTRGLLRTRAVAIKGNSPPSQRPNRHSSMYDDSTRNRDTMRVFVTASLCLRVLFLRDLVILTLSLRLSSFWSACWSFLLVF